MSLRSTYNCSLSELLLQKTKTLLLLGVFTVSSFNVFAQTTSLISDCGDFDAGPTAWPYVLVATTIADGAASQGSQTYTMNVTSLPAGGANVRVYKTTANGSSFFGNPVALTLCSNTITVAAVSFDRAVKFQFSSGDVEFDALSLNGDSSVCVGSISSSVTDVVDACDSYTYIVDGIFGYGLNRDLDNNLIDLIKSINQSSSKVISLDLPSGLNHATGQSMPVSLRCDHLISLLTMKRGLFTNQGRDFWREITVCKLINTEITSKNYLVTADNKFGNDSNIKSKNYYHEELHSTHKKSNGISCIVAGEEPYHGAMILAASAAIQSGSKYLQVYIRGLCHLYEVLLYVKKLHVYETEVFVYDFKFSYT